MNIQAGQILETAYASPTSNLAHPRHERNLAMIAPTGQFGDTARRDSAAETPDPLRLPRAVFEAIRRHGEETYPHESCGVLLGKPEAGGWRVERLMRMTNACRDSAGNRYEIEAAELVKVIREARAGGVEVAGFYHSHPDQAAEWSATDLREAHWPGLSYVITQVSSGNAEATRAFLLAGTSEEDKRFEAQGIRIEG